MMISDSTLEMIINKVNISTIVKHYIPIQKKGRNHWGLCPFHDDSQPSMSISDEKKIFKCFVCQQTGNIFSFVRDIENCSFVEAVKKVCEISGLDIPEISNMSIQKVQIDPEVQKTWEVNEEANNYFNFMLKTEEGKPAKQYLEGRGINAELVENFDIGFAPKNNKIIDFLEQKGYSETDLYKAGLISESEGRIYPNFRGRLTFAIRDENNNIIGFSARTIEKDVKPKYINSPETKTFIKGNFLYNFSNSRKAIRLEKKIIIVEGFMDVIALYKAGVKNVVATMGTALTKKHISLIKSISNNLVVFMDGDKAGAMATMSILKNAENETFDTKICVGVEGLDADEIINKYGTGKITEMLENTISGPEFIINFLAKNLELDSIDGKTKFIDKTRVTLSKVKNEFEKDQYIKLIAKKMNDNFEDIRHYFVVETFPKKPPQPTYQKPRKNSKFGTLQNEEIILLQGMLHYPEAVRLYRKEINQIISKEYQVLPMFLVAQLIKSDSISIPLLIAQFEKEDIDNRVIEVTKNLIHYHYRDSYNEKSILDSIKKIKEKIKLEKIQSINDKIFKSNDINEIENLIELKKKLREK